MRSFPTVFKRVLLAICAALLAACSGGGTGSITGSNNPNSASQLSLEEAEQVAQTFLKAWQQSDFPAMYELISPNSQAAFTQEQFVEQYDTTGTMLTLNTLETTVTSSLRQGTTAVIQYDLNFQTELFGPIPDANRIMRLIETPEGWRIAWSRMDIFAEMAEGARLVRNQTLPGRGNIYDRNGNVLADQNGRAVGLLLVRQDIPDEPACIDLLADVLRLEYADIEARFNQYNPDTLFQIGEIDPETYDLNQANLLQYCAIGDSANDTFIRTTRRYFAELAPHVVGYVGQIQDAQVAEYAQKGYPNDALIGQTGIEQSYQDYLAGKPGAELTIIGPTGERLREIASAASTPGQSVYLSIDRNLQAAVQTAFAEAYSAGTPTWSNTSPGAAAIVMDVRTGEILAMVSYPGFDPGLFNPDSPYFDQQQRIADLESDWRTPLLNRATMGLYPAGSVFKIISTAAGMDSGVYNPSSAISCTGTWYGEGYGDGLPYRTDWKIDGHGYVDLSHALTYSCNWYYWDMGAHLHAVDPEMVSKYALTMGLGSSTGLEDLEEEIGQVPDDALVRRLNARGWNIADTLNLVIGQGQLQVTPLQIVRLTAAVANGGTLYKPLLVSKVQTIGEEPVYVAEPTPTAVLDFAPETFELLQQGMCDVTLDPYGTARYMFEEWYEFHGMGVVVCGKTGTAQTGQAGTKPQAWFTAFAPQGDPQIAVTVIVENSCEGSEVAAPIVRRIVEDYFGMPHGTWPDLWQSGCQNLGEG